MVTVLKDKFILFNNNMKLRLIAKNGVYSLFERLNTGSSGKYWVIGWFPRIRGKSVSWANGSYFSDCTEEEAIEILRKRSM